MKRYVVCSAFDRKPMIMNVENNEIEYPTGEVFVRVDDIPPSVPVSELKVVLNKYHFSSAARGGVYREIKKLIAEAEK